MKIEIPWELYLKSAEENRKTVEGRILEACRRWPTSEYVEVLQNKLNLVIGGSQLPNLLSRPSSPTRETLEQTA